MTNKEQFISICKEKIMRDGINEFLNWIEHSDFFTAPASTKFHSNYVGGLCEHSLKVYREITRLNKLYELNFSEETLAITSLFHDICKTGFYKRGTRNTKNDYGQWTTKEVWEIDDTLPLGHGEKSCLILQRYFQLSTDELLAIRWHMGGFDTAIKGGDFGLNKAQDTSKLVTLISVADIIASNFFEETK